MKFFSFIILATSLISQAHSFTLPNQTPLRSYECSNCSNLSHENLSFSWNISNRKLGHLGKQEQASKKYFLNVNLQQLQNGVEIETEAPGAIIRVSPSSLNKGPKLDLDIKNVSERKSLRLIDASSIFSQDEALKESIFADNTVAIAALKPEMGAGKFIISARVADSTYSIASQNHNEQYVIHVFDKNSTTELKIAMDKASYHYGDELTAIISMDEEQIISVDQVEFNIKNPEGKKFPLEYRLLGKTKFEIKYPLIGEKNYQGKNWTIEARIRAIGTNSLWVNRQAHTSFSSTFPSAAIRELTRVSPNSFNFIAKIEAAVESRYALQAVLFATDSQGNLRPIQTVQSAAWLQAGQNELPFAFNEKLETKFKAPYYVGYLYLTDYGQQKPVFSYDDPIALSHLG